MLIPAVVVIVYGEGDVLDGSSSEVKEVSELEGGACSLSYQIFTGVKINHETVRIWACRYAVGWTVFDVTR